MCAFGLFLLLYLLAGGFVMFGVWLDISCPRDSVRIKALALVFLLAISPVWPFVLARAVRWRLKWGRGEAHDPRKVRGKR